MLKLYTSEYCRKTVNPEVKFREDSLDVVLSKYAKFYYRVNALHTNMCFAVNDITECHEVQYENF